MSASTVDCDLVPTPSAGRRDGWRTSAHRRRHKPSAHADVRVVRARALSGPSISPIPKVLGSRNSPVSAAAPSIMNHMTFEAASVLQIGKGPHWGSWPRTPASMSRRSIARVLRPSPPSSALVLDGTSGLRSAASEGEVPHSGLCPSLGAGPRCESGAGPRFPRIGAESGPRFPFPAKSGIGDSLFPGRITNRVPSPIPGKKIGDPYFENLIAPLPSRNCRSTGSEQPEIGAPFPSA